MLIVETIRKIRLAYHREAKPIRQIARDMNLSRNTVRAIIRSDVTELHYERKTQPRPKLEIYKKQLNSALKEDQGKPAKHRRSAQLLFEMLQREGFTGGYDTVRRFVKKWRQQEQSLIKAFVPLVFAPGEAFQFDWGYEQIELGGVNVKIKVAHFCLCHSRQPFCVAYLRETLEIVLDAHVQAFEFFGGACRRGIYDNLKTVVSKVLMGKERVFNRRFLALSSHYLFEPVACTPAAGWEKGQVERQVGIVRQRLFAKRRKFANLEELNQWLKDECRALAAAKKHPDYPEQTVATVASKERDLLVPAPVLFDAYQESTARVSLTSMVNFDRNSYSVQAMAVSKTVTIRAYADRISFIYGGQLIGLHRRQFGRDKTSYEPWHYLDVLKRKPGALRNGAPFQQWDLPEALQQARERIGSSSDGDRQFVGILAAVPVHGLKAVADACAEALSAGTISRDLVLNILSRADEQPIIVDYQPPDHLPKLRLLPQADCRRYDSLLVGGGHAS
jgi:transposase